MQIAQVMAGYSLGGADLLRRAMGKKKQEEMDKQKAFFVDGSEQNGISRDLAEKIFDLVEKFAGYGFNKSHFCRLRSGLLPDRLVENELSCAFYGGSAHG